MQVTERDPLTEAIIGAAIEVHRILGPGLLESAYEQCLVHELLQRGFKVRRQVMLPIRYKDITLEEGYRVDVIVEDQVILEIKAVDRHHEVHEAQLLTYMRLSGIHKGLLLNFQLETMRQGVKRYVL